MFGALRNYCPLSRRGLCLASLKFGRHDVNVMQVFPRKFDDVASVLFGHVLKAIFIWMRPQISGDSDFVCEILECLCDFSLRK